VLICIDGRCETFGAVRMPEATCARVPLASEADRR